MTIWTLITSLGDGSGTITNGHPDVSAYGGTFSFVGTLLGENVYALCSLFPPQIDSAGNSWVEGSPSIVAAGYVPSANPVPTCSSLEPCCEYVLGPIVVEALNGQRNDVEIGCSSIDGRTIVLIITIDENDIVTSTLYEVDGVTEVIDGSSLVDCYGGGGGGGGGGETTVTFGALVNSAASKTTPVDADMIPLMDSAAANITKKLSWLNLKNTLKTYFFGGATQGGVFFAGPSELPIEDDATFFYDNTSKTLKLLESAYNLGNPGWNSSSPSAFQIGNNITPHTFSSNPGFFGQKIDIYGAASSGSFKQLSGIRVRAQFAATGSSNGHTTSAIEAFVSNPNDTTANSNALLQALEGVVSVPNSIGRAQAGAFINNPGSVSNPTITTVQGVYSQIGNAGAFSATDVETYRAWVVTGGAVIQNLYGLKMNGWSGTGVVNSYGIYMDATIDRGNTLKYAIYSLSTSPSLFSGPVSGPINAYNSTTWNGSAKFVTEDAIRDEIEAIYTAIGGYFNKSIDDTDDITVGSTNKFATAAEKTKLGFISVTQAVDLDAIETRVNDLDAAIVLKGVWDASVGTFPGGGVAQAGWSYIVSVTGTVDTVTFNVGDRIIAILDNASTSTYASNWFKADYTDLVSSVNGQTGAVTLLVSEVDADNTLPVSNPLGEIRTLQDGRLFHGNAVNSYDQILKASNFGVRAVTGTSDTILSTDDKRLVTFTNAAAIAVAVPQAGSGSPAAFTNGFGFTAKNIGTSLVTFTPATSTVNGVATLVLYPGQTVVWWSNGTNYFASVSGVLESKSITVLNPGATEDDSMFFTDIAITVQKMVAVLTGSSTPSVTWTLRHSTDRSAAGNEVVTSGTTTTSTTTGSVVTTFNDATIPANSFVWLETTAQSGTVGSINISVQYTKD